MEQDEITSFLNTNLVQYWYQYFLNIFHIQGSTPTFCKLQDKKQQIVSVPTKNPSRKMRPVFRVLFYGPYHEVSGKAWVFVV
jgi:hypothetical protein